MSMSEFLLYCAMKLIAEQEVLLEQIELSEDISIKEIIERLESLKIEDVLY